MNLFVFKGAKSFFLISLILLVFLSACGGGGSGTPEEAPPSGDVVILSIDGGASNTYTEAYDPSINCDPRVDWVSGLVALYDNYLGGSNWDKQFSIMFPFAGISVQTYNIGTDEIQVYFIDSSGTYSANQILPNSSGTVTVTRVDTRIEGTFNVVLVDNSGNPDTGPALTGSFGVDYGISATCP